MSNKKAVYKQKNIKNGLIQSQIIINANVAFNNVTVLLYAKLISIGYISYMDTLRTAEKYCV